MKVKVTQSWLTLCNPMNYTVHRILQARILERVALPFFQVISTQGQNPGLRHCRQILEPKGKPKNTEEGSLSLLQQIFPTEELNQGLLHCRWILYQLSYQGSPIAFIQEEKIKCFFLKPSTFDNLSNHIQFGTLSLKHSHLFKLNIRPDKIEN